MKLFRVDYEKEGKQHEALVWAPNRTWALRVCYLDNGPCRNLGVALVGRSRRCW